MNTGIKWVALLLLSVFLIGFISQADASRFRTTTYQATWIDGYFPADFTYLYNDKKNFSGGPHRLEMHKDVYKKAAEFISRFEGFKSCVYIDPSGYPTIGYGHKIVSGEKFSCISKAKGKQLLQKDILKSAGKVIDASPQKLDFLNHNWMFSKDEYRRGYTTSDGGKFKDPTNGHRNANRDVTGRKLKGYNQSQMIALTSFMYNLGPEIIPLNWNGKLGRAIQNGDYKGIAAAMKLYDKSYTTGGKKISLPGLTRRRQAEAKLFLSDPEICWLTKNISDAKFQVRTCYRWK